MESLKPSKRYSYTIWRVSNPPNVIVIRYGEFQTLQTLYYIENQHFSIHLHQLVVVEYPFLLSARLQAKAKNLNIWGCFIYGVSFFFDFLPILKKKNAYVLHRNFIYRNIAIN